MLKMQAIEILVCKAFISTTTQTSIRAIRRKRSRSQQGDQRGSLRLSSRGEAGDKVGRQPLSEDRGNVNIGARRVREKGGKLVGKSAAGGPRVKPEGASLTITKLDRSERAEVREAGKDIFPDRGGAGSRVPQILAGGPAVPAPEPTSPGGSSVGVNFREELGK
jgi:hypothetical protein